MDPSVAVLTQKFDDHAASDAAAFGRIDKKLDAILVQTTATNGRVSSLEKSALVAETERAILQRIANQDRQHNKEVEVAATERRDAKFTRWQKLGIVAGIVFGLLATAASVLTVIHHV
jgi:low affinity Fe/Cu permease